MFNAGLIYILYEDVDKKIFVRSDLIKNSIPCKYVQKLLSYIKNGVVFNKDYYLFNKIIRFNKMEEEDNVLKKIFKDVHCSIYNTDGINDLYIVNATNQDLFTVDTTDSFIPCIFDMCEYENTITVFKKSILHFRLDSISLTNKDFSGNNSALKYISNYDKIKEELKW